MSLDNPLDDKRQEDLASFLPGRVVSCEYLYMTDEYFLIQVRLQPLEYKQNISM